jgi:hypothetical protein
VLWSVTTTPIGDLFAISTAVDRPLAVGTAIGIALANHGVVVMRGTANHA